MELNEIFKLEDYSKAYEYAANNDFLIQEIQPDEEGNRQFQIIQRLTIKTDEEALEEIRARREYECFPIVNRGQLWYSKLTEEQLAELDVWYKAWLDVTETKIIPEKPSWLN